MADLTVGVPVPVGERAVLVLAPNAGPWTFEGTNTWVLGEPGDDVCVVVDPGPDDDGHLDRVVQAAAGRRVAEVWLTHRHGDHGEGADALAARTGAVVRASTDCGAPFADGDRLRVGGLSAQVVATPGHTPDSVCFWLPEDRSLLTGDTLLGGGTPTLAAQGGLADMLGSLARLRALLLVPGARVLPGHGRVLDDPVTEVDRRIEARHRRTAQVAAAVAGGAQGPEEVTDVVYAGLDPQLRFAAELSVAAVLHHLGHAEQVAVWEAERQRRWRAARARETAAAS